ncbi:cytidylate kinase family protein [Candidatus Woesearchaeota archaeon]|nr:cytidylate kinase family protein [Candidatus Woesearchaeota archaeon]
MKITISGTPGSGKSVVGKYISKKLRLKYYGVGELMRKFAKKNKIDLIELSELLNKNNKLDKNFNEDIKKFNRKDNFVLDSRLGFLFITKGIHLFLDADLDLRAKRIFKDKRKLENFKTIDGVKKEIRERLLMERQRFKKLYNVDFTDLRHYDLVIDTTGMNVNIISNIILKYLKNNKIIR